MAPIQRFIKIILDFNIQLRKLEVIFHRNPISKRLPLKFAMSNNNELADIAKFCVSDGRVWEMKVKRDLDGHIWFESGFHRFAKYYSIKHGHLLYFNYNNMSNFTVRIFDTSCSEISYPSQNYASGNSPNPSTKRRKISNKNPKTATRRNERYAVCDYRSQSGFLSPRHFKSKRPYFEVKLKSYNSRLNVVYVPKEFSEEYMAETRAERFKLEVCDGRQWKVSLKRKRDGRFSLGKGWNVFYEENNLKERDVCIFELARKTANVFKVFVFVAL